MKTNAKGLKQFCRLPRKRNTLLKFMDGIWTQTNWSSIDFNRDKVSLQLFHHFSVVPCNLHSSILQTESQGLAKLAEMPLYTPTVSLLKHKQL